MIWPWGVEADPTAQGRLKGAQPVAVLDIGSNSVRLVVYERHARALTALYNEKASCALGRGVAATGHLSDENVARALKAIQRFALVAKLMDVGQVHILATSAVRDAINGPAFSARVQDIMGAPVRVLTGPEEAHFAALGVFAGMPDFAGVVGDLGGGSLELSQVDHGNDLSGETHELGVIRLQDDCDGSVTEAAALTRERLKASRAVKTSGGVFCAIGGTWRSLAKLHQKYRKYPLRMVQNYAVSADEILKLCDLVTKAYEEKGTYPFADAMSSSRRGLVPFGAAVLAETLRLGGFKSVVFSALGVREGFLFNLLEPAEQDVDPLIQICEEMSVLRARSPAHAVDLSGFSEQFIEMAGMIETPDEMRLREAVCLLSDIGWRGHPDYRGGQSVNLVAFGALVGIDHPGRAFLAEALAVRYMGLKQKSVSASLLKLAGAKRNRRARLLGALLRVAYPMSAGMPGILSRTSFAREGKALVLKLPTDLAFLDGERLESRLGQLANVGGFEDSTVRID